MWQRVNVAWGNLITVSDWRRPWVHPRRGGPCAALGRPHRCISRTLRESQAEICDGPHHKAIRAKLSPTELPALETALETPQQSSR
ncbi:hypothetical protein QJQ45_030176 [Haematococcus lacustris]|nr:hypothetical protein QJQ45_030176 [Haematococcus lacustris]